jgi:hypothetical protein
MRYNVTREKDGYVINVLYGVDQSKRTGYVTVKSGNNNLFKRLSMLLKDF